MLLSQSFSWLAAWYLHHCCDKHILLQQQIAFAMLFSLQIMCTKDNETRKASSLCRFLCDFDVSLILDTTVVSGSVVRVTEKQSHEIDGHFLVTVACFWC